MDLAIIPGGSFMMGSPEDEEGREPSEGPQHQVTLSDFEIGRTPVTQAQWKAVAALPKVNIDIDPDPSHFKELNHPVERVNWYDAVEFCDRLAKYAGKSYRLPSEAEWEYACRAGTTTSFHFGGTLTPGIANYGCKYCYSDGPTVKSLMSTTAVGRYPPNAFGLQDMHGSIFEWCADIWHDNYEGAPTDGSAWVEKTKNSKPYPVRRGGSWRTDPRYCRSASRRYLFHNVRGSNFGFRVVVSAPTLVRRMLLRRLRQEAQD